MPQLRQERRSFTLTLPASHGAQISRPVVSAYNPVGHLLHVACVVSSWYKPNPHGWQLPFSKGCAVPVAQPWHCATLLLPTLGEKAPMPQPLHDDTSVKPASVPYVLIGQLRHTTSLNPTKLLYLPNSQMVQSGCPKMLV
jgi:hypothetical protein